MALFEVVRTIIISFQPQRYRELSTERPKKIFNHLLLFIILIFLLSGLTAIPTMLSFKSNLGAELDKVKSLDISGSFETRAPVYITGDVVVDTSDTKKVIADEKLLVTKENIYFNLWGPMKIKIEKILHPLRYKTHFVSVIVLLAIILAPSILLFLLGLFLIKFVLLTLISGLFVFFVLRILFLIRIRARGVLNICFLAAIPPALLEGLVMGLFPGLLVPLAGILTFKVNLIPLLLYVALLTAGFVLMDKELRLPKKTKEGDEKLEWGFG